MSWSDFWVGVASGLFVSVVLYCSRYFFGSIVNCLAGVFSRKIRGDWDTVFKKGTQEYKEYAKVYQVFHWVWGTIDFPDRRKVYKFHGTVTRDILVATYERKGDSDDLDRGAFTLCVNPVSVAKQLSGKYAWTDDSTQKPEANDYNWVRRS